jgi:hypothetical protein
MDNDEKRLRHLEMIQSVISLMAQNSFSIKTWTVTLVAGLFALAADKASPVFVLVAYIPLGAFWILDGYYLWQERLYRAYFDQTRQSAGVVDYSMDASGVSDRVDSWCAVALSSTLRIFYGVLFVTILVVMLALVHMQGNCLKP